MLGPVCLIGCTASGKTSLALILAELFEKQLGKKCSAISVDSIQKYKGLSISSAKPDEQELSKLSHSNVSEYLDCDSNSNVTDFVTQADRDIKSILEKKEVPILVGGTFNYLRALLFRYIMTSDKHLNESFDKREKLAGHYSYETLCKIDPEYAAKLHPNDLRKIDNACEAFFKNNIKLSQYHKSQDLSCYYKNTSAIYLDFDTETLENRIRKRFDSMHINDKVIEEFKTFYENNQNWILKDEKNLNMKFGILQSIGFKEFLPFLSYSGDDESRRSTLFEKCKNLMLQRTISYSKRQRKFISKHLLPHFESNKIPILHLKNIAEKDILVENCHEFVENLESDKNLDKYLNYGDLVKEDSSNPIVDEKCNECARDGVPLVFRRKVNWDSHLKSKGHRYRVSKAKNSQITDKIVP